MGLTPRANRLVLLTHACKLARAEQLARPWLCPAQTALVECQKWWYSQQLTFDYAAFAQR